MGEKRQLTEVEQKEVERVAKLIQANVQNELGRWVVKATELETRLIELNKFYDQALKEIERLKEKLNKDNKNAK